MLKLRRITGKSMEPTLISGRVVVISGTRRVRAGDIVVVRHEGIEKIKRIVTYNIDKIFVIGDNSELSTDSRHFGWLPYSVLQGKVIWPRNLNQHLYQK